MERLSITAISVWSKSS
ncbi:hypothetical protein pdam_00001839 [Pocillopora damicornis]|uniref:Uncharacterized protein n=1 Tax=Pocillopora damicornis TaxID=46731 RepID=A0A3M6TNK1_POCDA|nr:hypothetical protein pdam_00001839 [Pocillopora damicornis]